MKNMNNVKEGEGISRVCVGWVQDSVPDYRKKKAAVEVHVRGGFPGLDGLHSPPLPAPFSSSLDCATIPVDAVA